MSVNNPWQITYGSRSVGGSSNSFLLNGPYSQDKAFDAYRLVFEVIVVSSSYSTLQSLSDTLEDDFRLRDRNLVIDLNGSTWTYTAGRTILNVTSSITKTGDEATDMGYARAYTVVIEGELPADDASPVTGLRDIEWHVQHEGGRPTPAVLSGKRTRRTISCQGVYTATNSPAQLASVNYEHANGADAEAVTFLAGLSGSSSYELVDEDYTTDRNNHVCRFARQWVELLANQTAGSLNDDDINENRMVFTDLSSHPGDSKENVSRLRRVIANYDCSATLTTSDPTDTDITALWDTQIKPHVLALFKENFDPTVFCVEDKRVSYDETAKRIAATIQFLYQKSGGEDIVEISQSLAFRESRTIDYTPIHEQSEFAAYADEGWAVRERVASRTVIVVGDEKPKRRLGTTDKDGDAGAIKGIEAGAKVKQSGWNIVSNTSQVDDRWLGDPDFDQIKVSTLTETVVERFNELPDNRTRPPTQGPTKTTKPTTKESGSADGGATRTIPGGSQT